MCFSAGIDDIEAVGVRGCTALVFIAIIRDGFRAEHMLNVPQSVFASSGVIVKGLFVCGGSVLICHECREEVIGLLLWSLIVISSFKASAAHTVCFKVIVVVLSAP